MSSSKISKNVEELQNLKNLVNNNLIEIINPSIKQKSNENVLKFMDVIKERPESWFEFISIAIFHQNFQIMKYMIETFRIVPSHNPSLNALNFYNDILPENSELKIKDHKELYLDFDCPLILQACIGGDEEIFLYLMKHQFGKNLLNINGFIGLSKKYKNAFTSNLIGACSYYGRYKLLDYLIKNYKFDLNFPSIEKKAKNKHSGFIKEYTGLTPISLAILSEIAKEDEIIKIIKLLHERKCSLKESDFLGNNLLHIAVKGGKLNIIKFLIEELNCKKLAIETNKEGQTPMAIAQSLNKKEIIDYLKEKTEIVDEKLEEDLLQLIESSHNKKKGKKKKGKNNDIPLLNTGSYEESLQISKISNKEKNKDDLKESFGSEDKKSKKKIEEDEEEKKKKNKEKEEKEEEEEEEEEVERNYKNNKRENSFGYKNKNYNDNYHKRGYNNNYNNYNYYKNKRVNSYYNYNDSYNNKRGNTHYNNNNYYEEKEIIQTEFQNNNNNDEQDHNYIIGLNKKKQRKNKYKNRNYSKEESNKIYEKEIKENIINEEPEEKKEIEIEIKIKEDDNENIKNEIIIEEKKRENETEIKKEEKKEEIEIEIKKEEKKEEIEQKEVFIKKEIEQDYDDDGYDDDFLPEDNEQESNLNPQPQIPIKDDSDYMNLYNKYNELQRNYENISKEKEELENYIKRFYLVNKRNTQNILSNDDNINDLLYLANKELEEKNKIIENLNNQIAINDLTNIQNFSLNKLKTLKEKYSENLKKINEVFKTYNEQ